MSKIVYVGQIAGLVAPGEKRGKGGDANSAFDYELYCSCETQDAAGRAKPTFLGPLGRFRPNAEGVRSVVCGTCNHVTAVDAGGQILGVVPLTKLLEGKVA